MKRILFASALLLAILPAFGQAPARPMIETTKVEGTDDVYIFRHGNHQSIFIVTPEGVIATDPVAYGRPQGGAAYVAEIRKITDKPIKYLVYSHHHYDHIAGGQAFKDAGATIVAHRRAKERLEMIQDPHTPLPDETFAKFRTLRVGDAVLELSYVGLTTPTARWSCACRRRSCCSSSTCCRWAACPAAA